MPLLDHVRELRVRLIRVVIALAAGFIVAYFFSDQLFAALTLPIRQVSHGKLLLIGTGVGEAFFTKIKVSLIAGLFLASPAVFYESWKFIAPGCISPSAKWRSPSSFSRPLFHHWRLLLLGGGVQSGLRIFSSRSIRVGVTPTIRISEYLAFSAKLMLAFAITFEMPIFAVFLTRLGLIDYRMMLKYFRYAILVSSWSAAALTPPDMVSHFPARHSAAAPLRHQRRRFLSFRAQNRTRHRGGRSSPPLTL